MTSSTQSHLPVVIIGAGPGGLSVAGALIDQGLAPEKFLVLDRGEVGQAWLDYPEDTHLLSESNPAHDENMIAGVETAEVFAHIPHPSHLMYQKYLHHVAEKKNIPVRTNTTVENISFDAETQQFVIVTRDGEIITADKVVWAAGMYCNPNENLDMEGCYIHYARMPYMDDMVANEVTVVGSANGANGVVMELAKPGRKVTLVVSREYAIPLPIDCLWKENMQFIKDLEKQGLVKIIEHFRVKRIFKDGQTYFLESEDGRTLSSPAKPIICTGFLPNIDGVTTLVEQHNQEKEVFLNLDEFHQSLRQPGFFVAGTIGRLEHNEGFIRNFRDFGKVIAEQIVSSLS